LVGMGILPLELPAGTSVTSLGLSGEELYSIHGIAGGLAPRARLTVHAVGSEGTPGPSEAPARLDNDCDVDYLRHGGTLPMVLRGLLRHPDRPCTTRWTTTPRAGRPTSKARSTGSRHTGRWSTRSRTIRSRAS